MFDFLSSSVGLSALGLIGIIIFLLYMKLMAWVWKIAILGMAILGAYWYFKPALH